MSRFSCLSRWTNLLLAVAFLGLTGCENGNLFGKLNDSGGSSDISVLQADAQIALDNKDFASALRLYERILEQDPDNAVALHGAAIAATAAAGLNFGAIMENIASQTSAAPSINGLSDLMAAARIGFASHQTETNSLLAGINIDALDDVIDLAICRLAKIISGAADGSIPANDPAVLLDIGSLCLVRGILRPLQAEFFDVTNTNGDYELVAKAEFGTFCGNVANEPLIVGLANDLVGAYALFNRAADVLGVANNSIIQRITDELDQLVVALLTMGGPSALPNNCITVINNAGINSTNFRTNTGAFNPPSDC